MSFLLSTMTGYILCAQSIISLFSAFCLSSLLNTRDQSWAEVNKMGAFRSVGKGSREPSVFLEMKYSGAQESDSPPLIFVGKGKCKLDQVACPFDMLIVTFLALNNAAPSYISDLFTERQTSISLRGKCRLVNIRRVNTTNYGLHSFRYHASKL